MKRLVFLLLILVSATYSGAFYSGSASCPASGAVQISTTSYALYQLTVTANLTNTGYVHLGGSNVTTSTGGVLTAGASYAASKPNAGINPTTLYFACTASGDGVTWIGSN